VTETANQSLIPFVAAVTGHRDIRPQDKSSLEKEVRSVFATLRAQMPSTPIVLLTGLAEGADQFVAEIALKESVEVAAVLPMPLNIYRKHMSRESQMRLDELVLSATLRIQLPLDGRSEADIENSDSVRASCYEALGHFLATHSQALLALWDGADSKKRGGTSSVVHYFLSSRSLGNSLGGDAGCELVYHVITPRTSNSRSDLIIRTRLLECITRTDVSPGVARSAGESIGLSPISDLELNLDRFNRDARTLPGTSRSYQPLMGDNSHVSLSSFQMRLQTLYQQADAIAVQANERRKIFLAALLMTAVIGTIFYGIHGEILENRVWLWFSFPVFVVAAFLLHRAAVATHIDERYLDARALAEAIRVQFFWDIAGIARSVDLYRSPNKNTRTDWIQIALRNLWLLRQNSDGTSAEKPDFGFVLDKWLRGQERWYRQEADREARIVRRRARIAHYGLVGSVVWSVVVPASILVRGPWINLSPWKTLAPGNWMYQTFHIVLAVPALLAGAYRLWIEQAGYEEQTRDYRYMENQFAIKAREVEEHLNSPQLAEKLFLEMGVEALKENERWLQLHRERPLEVLSSP
jgi:hypothetical protein